MNSVQHHYETLLAGYYSWIYGGFERKAAENEAFFDGNGISAGAAGLAVDLGCGSGFQSIPLARRGYSVLAVDTSRALLDELAAHADAAALSAIRAVNDNLLNFKQHLDGPLSLAVCMGDTLTHLESPADVSLLCARVHGALAPGGRFIITYRDLSFELAGTDRLIPVMEDDERLFLCFIEYRDHGHAVINDIVITRKDAWSVRKSWYVKLRLPAPWVAGELTAAGFTVERNAAERGFVTMIARKP